MENNLKLSELSTQIVSGFTLCGYKRKNGYSLGPKKDSKEIIKELPKEIECNSIIYCLENIEVYKNNFFNAIYC